MPLDFKEELGKISGLVSEKLKEDPFPGTVYPECLQDAVRSYPLRGGKRLRPALVLWSCGLLGGDLQKAVSCALAVEVFHSWTLVHDDIIDEDEFRRGVPTSHIELKSYAEKHFQRNGKLQAKFGHDFAILAGDIQQAWANDLLLRSEASGCTPELTLAMMRRMEQVLNRELISGEALDVQLPMMELPEISEKEVLKVIDGKTVCLLKFCVQCGAAIALNDPGFQRPEQEILGRFADGLGTAFQLRDDYLGIFGDEKQFGKPIGSDFQEAKPTLLYIYAVNHLDPAGKKELLSLTGLPEYGEKEIGRIRELLNQCGGDRMLSQAIQKYTQNAENALAQLPQNDYADLLKALLQYLLLRNI